MRRRGRTAAGGTAVLLLLLVATGCGLLGGNSSGDDAPPASGSKLEQSKIRVSLQKVVEGAAFYVAMDKGYFTQEGLTIDYAVAQKGSAVIDNLLGGSVDIGMASYPPGVLANAKNKDAGLKIIADGGTTTEKLFALVVKKDSPIKTASDLVGKKIAVSSKGGIGELALRSHMQLKGVPTDEKQFIPLGFADMPNQLGAGNVDAAVMNEPFLTNSLRNDGVVELFNPFQGPTANFPTTGFFAGKQFLNKAPHAAEAFVRAMIKGARDTTDRTVVEASIEKWVAVPKEVAMLMRLPEFPTTVDPSRLQRVPDLMHQVGELDRTIVVTMRDMIWDVSLNMPK